MTAAAAELLRAISDEQAACGELIACSDGIVSAVLSGSAAVLTAAVQQQERAAVAWRDLARAREAAQRACADGAGLHAAAAAAALVPALASGGDAEASAALDGAFRDLTAAHRRLNAALEHGRPLLRQGLLFTSFALRRMAACLRGGAAAGANPTYTASGTPSPPQIRTLDLRA